MPAAKEYIPQKLLIVEWDDAGTYPGWATKKAKRAKYEMVSVGWEIPESDERYLRLAATREKDTKDHGDLSAIPRGCITKVTEIASS